MMKPLILNGVNIRLDKTQPSKVTTATSADSGDKTVVLSNLLRFAPLLLLGS